MVVLLILLVLLTPLFVQFNYGVKALSGWIKLKFWELTLLCFFSEFILSIVLFFVVMFIESLFQEPNQSLGCGFGYAGLVLFGVPISVLILIVALIQYVINKNNS